MANDLTAEVPECRILTAYKYVRDHLQSNKLKKFNTADPTVRITLTLL